MLSCFPLDNLVTPHQVLPFAEKMPALLGKEILKGIMSTTESDPAQTENQATIQGISGPEVEGEQSPRALWDHLRQELRTPLDAIISNSELLLGDADSLVRADFIATLNLIHSAGQQLLEIIDDLLDSNKFASSDVVFNLASLVANLHYKVRIPINDIIGFSETLLENAAEQGRPDLIADLKKIQSAAEYVRSYINEIIRIPPGAPVNSRG